MHSFIHTRLLPTSQSKRKRIIILVVCTLWHANYLFPPNKNHDSANSYRSGSPARRSCIGGSDLERSTS